MDIAKLTARLHARRADPTPPSEAERAARFEAIAKGLDARVAARRGDRADHGRAASGSSADARARGRDERFQQGR
jgi:hypothetical protein